MKFQLFFAAVAVLALAGCASVKEIESPSSMTLETLESKMNQVIDPDGKYDKTKSFVQRQIVITERFMDDPEEKIVETKFQDPSNIKITSFVDNEEESAIIYNGKNGWMVNYSAKKVTEITGDMLERIGIMSLMASPQSKLSSVFKDIKITEAEINDDHFYKISCRRKAGDVSVINIYVDSQSYLISQIKATLQIDGNHYEYDTVITKYATNDGIKIPAETTVNAGGITQHTRVIYYKLDPVFKDSEFLPPGF